MASDPVNTSTTMNDLPNELLTFIFEQLNINDLIRCSLVSKRFMLICKYAAIPELIISSRVENIKDIWFHTNKQFNHQDAIDVKTFNTFRSRFRLDRFRRLQFKGTRTEYEQLNFNDFKRLEQVKVEMKHAEGDDFIVYIDLPNLKIIEIDSSHECLITSPKLEMMKCSNFDLVHLTNPKNIKHLEATVHAESVHVLENLQFYEVDYGTVNDTAASNLLSVFPKLKTLIFSRPRYYNPMDMYSLRDLILEKLTLRRSEVKIYFEGVEMVDVWKVNEFNYFLNSIAFQINNYKTLSETVNLQFGFNYNELMAAARGKIPDDFSKKFFRTRHITVIGQVQDRKHLFQFLKKFDYLSELYLDSYSLDQNFCDSLSELQQLTKVTMKIISKSISNFTFLTKLKLLESFTTTSDSLEYFELALKLFKNSKYFSYIGFNFQTDSISIKKFFPLNCYYFRITKQIGAQDFGSKYDFNGLVRLYNLYASKHHNVQIWKL